MNFPLSVFRPRLIAVAALALVVLLGSCVACGYSGTLHGDGLQGCRAYVGRRACDEDDVSGLVGAGKLYDGRAH